MRFSFQFLCNFAWKTYVISKATRAALRWPRWLCRIWWSRRVSTGRWIVPVWGHGTLDGDRTSDACKFCESTDCDPITFVVRWTYLSANFWTPHIDSYFYSSPWMIFCTLIMLWQWMRPCSKNCSSGLRTTGPANTVRYFFWVRLARMDCRPL